MPTDSSMRSQNVGQAITIEMTPMKSLVAKISEQYANDLDCPATKVTTEEEFDSDCEDKSERLCHAVVSFDPTFSYSEVEGLIAVVKGEKLIVYQENHDSGWTYVSSMDGSKAGFIPAHVVIQNLS